VNRGSRIVVDTLLPDGVQPVPSKGALGAGWEEFHRAFERDAAERLRLALRAALFGAIWVAPILIGRIPPLTLYGRETRERALEALERSRLYSLRQLLGLLKVTVALCYGADPQVRDAIGYPLQHDDPRRVGGP
jgi:hypothetical protein